MGKSLLGRKGFFLIAVLRVVAGTNWQQGRVEASYPTNC